MEILNLGLQISEIAEVICYIYEDAWYISEVIFMFYPWRYIFSYNLHNFNKTSSQIYKWFIGEIRL